MEYIYKIQASWNGTTLLALEHCLQISKEGQNAAHCQQATQQATQQAIKQADGTKC